MINTAPTIPSYAGLSKDVKEIAEVLGLVGESQAAISEFINMITTLAEVQSEMNKGKVTSQLPQVLLAKYNEIIAVFSKYGDLVSSNPKVAKYKSEFMAQVKKLTDNIHLGWFGVDYPEPLVYSFQQIHGGNFPVTFTQFIQDMADGGGDVGNDYRGASSSQKGNDFLPSYWASADSYVYGDNNADQTAAENVLKDFLDQWNPSA